MTVPSIHRAPRASTQRSTFESTHHAATKAAKAGAAKNGGGLEVASDTSAAGTKPNLGVYGSGEGKRATQAGGVAASGGLSPAQQARVDAARDAMVPLGRELPGHGIDIDAFAMRYASAQHQDKTPAQVGSDARHQFMTSALAAHPELADAAVALRTRSLSRDERDVVRRAADEAGTGVAKLAAAERAIGAMKGLRLEEVGDVREMMKHGARFGDAVRTERAELARPTETGPSMGEKIEASVSLARAQGKQCQALQQAVLEAYRGVPNVSWFAEKTVGVAGGTGTVGTLAAADSVHARKAAVDNAAYAGSLIAGELREQIGVARRLYTEFSNAYAEYRSANQQYQDALRSGDHAATVANGARMETLVVQMKRDATAIAACTKRVGEMDQRFDATAAHAAIHVTVAAMGAGISMGTSAPISGGIARHPIELDHAVLHTAGEAGAVRTVSDAIGH